MKNKWTLITGVTCGLCFLFFIFSTCIAPLSVEHGLNVSYAKGLLQGAMPYQDMPMEEAPIGIGFLSMMYALLGIGASSYWASGLMVLVHLLNMGLIYQLLKRLHVEGAPVWGALCFYVLLVFSSDGLMLRMEPFAVTFLLLAYQLILKRTQTMLLAAIGCFVLAMGCQTQSICLLPVLAIPVFWRGRHNRFSTEKGLFFTTTSLILGFLGFVLIAWITGNSKWDEGLGWTMEEPEFLRTQADLVYNKLLYVGIQAGRCSLFFFFFFWLVWKNLKGYDKKAAFMGLCAFLGCAVTFIWQVEVGHFQLAYPFIAMALAHLLKGMPSANKAGILWVSVLLIPAALTVREYLKLEHGALKSAQQEEISVLKEIVQKPGVALVQFEECHEFDLGPQIFAELPQLDPMDAMDENAWKDVDYIIMNEEGFTQLSYSDFSDAFFEAIYEMKSYSTGELLIYSK